MRHAEIRTAASDACHAIADAGLVLLTFGNASAVDRERGVFAIKPSGISCTAVTAEQCVVVAIEDGTPIDGSLQPSTDAPTHRLLYQRFPAIGGVVHTHSPEATAWAQAGRSIPCLGTTHADHVPGALLVTRQLTDAEVASEHEWHTGVAIAELFEPDGSVAAAAPGVLVRSHGPFTWGRTAAEAAANAEIVERVARLARLTLALNPRTSPVSEALRRRHFDRKHGPTATYGQGAVSGRAGER